MSKHHVQVSQLSIETGGDQPKPGPYMNVTAMDYRVLGVTTHGHQQKTFLYRNREGFIGLFAFPDIPAFNEYSAYHKGEWQEVEMLKRISP